MHTFHKAVPTAARLILGLVFTVFGLNFFLHFLPVPPAPPRAAAFAGALFGSGYLFPLLKSIEVAAGLLLLGGLFVPLALAVLAPILVNIIGFHLFLEPSGLPIPLALLAAELLPRLELPGGLRADVAPANAAAAAVARSRARAGASGGVTARHSAPPSLFGGYLNIRPPNNATAKVTGVGSSTKKDRDEIDGHPPRRDHTRRDTQHRSKKRHERVGTTSSSGRYQPPDLKDGHEQREASQRECKRHPHHGPTCSPSSAQRSRVQRRRASPARLRSASGRGAAAARSASRLSASFTDSDVRELLSNVRIEEDHIRTLPVALHILAADPTREVVLRQQLVVFFVRLHIALAHDESSA